jgi:hypothetical protein
MAQKYFPINTATSCQLKWNWSTLYLHGAQTASCHRTGWGKLTSENFNQFHNTEKKQQERSEMLQGKWPTESCQYCREIEESGGFSDRMLHLTIPDMVPPELDDNPTATNVSPTILEVFFNNTCNLSCLYCLPTLSSKINQEHSKFGNFNVEGVQLYSSSQNSDYSSLLDKFWSWMYSNSHTLKRFNVLGGEPFYQAEFYKLIEYFEQHPHPNLELGIVTNLMIDSDKLELLIARFRSLLAHKHLKRIDVTCSIDCWGNAQEYVRFGIDLDQWEKNFKLLLGHKWLTLNINQTISVLTIKTMPTLLEKLIEWRQQHSIGHYFSAVSPQPSYLMPHIMGSTVFDNDFETILQLMPSTTDQDCTAISYMKGIQNQILESEPNQVEKHKLKIFLDEKDRRRNTNWKQVFPWLEKEIEHVV